MSRTRLKKGEKAHSFAVSFAESEYQQVVKDSEATSGGNVSQFFREIYRIWKALQHYERRDKKLAVLEQNLQQTALAVRALAEEISNAEAAELEKLKEDDIGKVS
jgi:hypothetical protein